MGETRFTPGPWKVNNKLKTVVSERLQDPASALKMFKALEEIKRLIEEYLNGTHETLAVGLTKSQKMRLIDPVSRDKFTSIRGMINAVLLTVTE